MKVFKKVLPVILISCLLLVPFAGTAQAADLIDPDNINSILSFFNIDTSDPESIQKAIDEIREGGLSGIMSILGIDVSEILDELQSYLGAMTPSTTKPQETTTEEPTTEEPATEEPTTEEPTTRPPVYVPTTYPSYVTPTTQPPVQSETTTFQFIPPEQIYTEAFTTTVFNPIVEDDISSIKDDTNPIKTAIGVLLLLGSGIGVVIVVLALKRNRI